MISDNESESENLAQEDQNQDDDNAYRQQIREDIKTMSFEELLKLKEKVGSKLYNQAVYGDFTDSKTKRQPIIKRSKKDKPREISSKIRPYKIRALLNSSKPTILSKSQIKEVEARDPRFDPKAGEFDKATFKENYRFVNDLKQKERVQLQKEYEECDNPLRKKKIKMLINRIDNQFRAEDKLNREKEKETSEKDQIKDKIKRGEKPVFKKKSVKKLENLLEKYEELKKNNQVQKHIAKRVRKLKLKDKKEMAHIK